METLDPKPLNPKAFQPEPAELGQKCQVLHALIKSGILQLIAMGTYGKQNGNYYIHYNRVYIEVIVGNMGMYY